MTDRASQGRRARQRGNAYERSIAERLGGARVGQYGTKVDVEADWIVVQAKVGKSYPERLDGWLRALPKDGRLRALVVGDSPGAGHRRRELVVLDLDEFIEWFGKA
jgi:hypothetical protein